MVQLTTALGFEHMEGRGDTFPFSALRSLSNSVEAAPGAYQVEGTWLWSSPQWAGGKQPCVALWLLLGLFSTSEKWGWTGRVQMPFTPNTDSESECKSFGI